MQFKSRFISVIRYMHTEFIGELLQSGQPQYLLFAAVNLPFLLWRECKHSLSVLVCEIQFILEIVKKRKRKKQSVPALVTSNRQRIMWTSYVDQPSIKGQRTQWLPENPKIIGFTVFTLLLWVLPVREEPMKRGSLNNSNVKLPLLTVSQEGEKAHERHEMKNTKHWLM